VECLVPVVTVLDFLSFFLYYFTDCIFTRLCVAATKFESWRNRMIVNSPLKCDNLSQVFVSLCALCVGASAPRFALQTELVLMLRACCACGVIVLCVKIISASRPFLSFSFFVTKNEQERNDLMRVEWSLVTVAYFDKFQK